MHSVDKCPTLPDLRGQALTTNSRVFPRGNTGQLLPSVVVPSGLYPGVLSDEVKRKLRALYGYLMKNLKVIVVRITCAAAAGNWIAAYSPLLMP